MRGRKPKPTRLKILTGKPGRGINKHEPKPRATMPRCPRELAPEARREWRKLAGELARLGLLTIVDGNALAIYCQAWAQYKRATTTLEAEGLEVKCGRRADAKKAHPALRTQSEAIETIRKFSALFGLDPADRARLQTPAPAATDQLEAFLDCS
jgi:P27 family predicted phage terminase small subunit